MSTESERQVVNIVAPTQSNTAGLGVTILAATTTAANTAIPTNLFGRYVYLIAEGDKIWVTFGPNGTPVIDKSANGGATFVLGTNSVNGMPIPDGGRVPVRLNASEHTYIHWQANAANSKLIIYPTTPKSSRKVT